MIFCIIAEIIIQHPDILFTLVHLLRGFHLKKLLMHCIGNYAKGSSLEDALIEIKVFEVKILEQVLSGTSFVRSLRELKRVIIQRPSSIKETLR